MKKTTYKLLVVGICLLLMATGCGTKASTQENNLAFLTRMLTAPNAEILEAMRAMDAVSGPDEAEAILKQLETVYYEVLGDSVAEDATDRFIGNSLNDLQKRLLLADAAEVTTTPTDIEISASTTTDGLYLYDAVLTVAGPEATYEGLAVSGKLQLDENGKITAMTVVLSSELKDALTAMGA